MGLRRRWDIYWFRSSPLLNLAVCRLILVGFQLRCLVTDGFHAEFQRLSSLPDTLYDPLPVLHLLTWPFGWHYRPSVGVLDGMYVVTFLAGLLALVGWRTNFSLILFALGNVFMQAFCYSFGEFHHPEALLMIALSVLAVSPAGAVWSLDDLGRRRRQAAGSLRLEPVNLLDEESAFARWPLLVIQWTLAAMYLSAAWHKLAAGRLVWANGYTLQYYMIQDGLRWNRPWGLWLGQHHTLVSALSWASLLFESTFFLVLVFPRLAWIYLPLGAAFHTGIYLTMQAPFFQLIVLYAVFVPWAAVFRVLKPTEHAVVLYDGQCPLCLRSMAALQYVDWLKRLEFKDLETNGRTLLARLPGTSLEDCRRDMHVILPDGSVHKGFFAFRALIARLPLLWPLLIVFYAPLASTVGPKIYHVVASRRLRVQRCSNGTCALHTEKEPGPVPRTAS